MSKERVLLFGLAASLVSSVPVFATTAPTDRGKTQLRVGVAQATPDMVSFEVPLYLTMCVTKEVNGTNSKVVMPTKEYYIRNTTPDIPLAVTGMGTAGVAGGDWSLVDRITPGATGKELTFGIGGVRLPAVSAGDTSVKTLDIRAQESSFYDAANGRFRLIGAEDTVSGQTTVLEVSAEVADAYTPSDQPGAVAQFRVMYTVSCVDPLGNVMDKDYNGPGREEATTPAP